MKIGEIIREKRKELSVTQEQLSTLVRTGPPVCPLSATSCPC